MKTGFIVAFVLGALILTAFVWPDIASRSVPGSRGARMDVWGNPVIWEADVIAVLEGGQALGFARVGDGLLFYADISAIAEAVPGGRYRVSGDRVGETCGYQHTVFGGSCVPEVRVRELLPVSDGESP